MVLNELLLMRRLTAGAKAGRPLEWLSHRDPVCGMAMQAAEERLAVDGLTLGFCSKQCRDKFVAAPERYLGHAPPAPAPFPGAHAGAP
jgi:YHS domain-containing protein